MSFVLIELPRAFADPSPTLPEIDDPRPRLATSALRPVEDVSERRAADVSTRPVASPVDGR